MTYYILKSVEKGYRPRWYYELATYDDNYAFYYRETEESNARYESDKDKFGEIAAFDNIEDARDYRDEVILRGDNTYLNIGDERQAQFSIQRETDVDVIMLLASDDNSILQEGEPDSDGEYYFKVIDADTGDLIVNGLDREQADDVVDNLDGKAHVRPGRSPYN